MPERIDWYFEQTTKEAEHRRKEISRVNTMTFCSKLMPLVTVIVLAFLMAIPLFWLPDVNVTVGVLVIPIPSFSIAGIFLTVLLLIIGYIKSYIPKDKK